MSNDRNDKIKNFMEKLDQYISRSILVRTGKYPAHFVHQLSDYRDDVEKAIREILE